jgi:EAL domain-containing protein (putative c-di-GMP-specific phosphodiesterase class I)
MNDIGRDLARGIGRGELHVLYQPVVGLDDERLTAVEALVRWDRPGDEMWLPDRFLPVAENDGTIVDLDRWVLRTALASLAAWRERGLAADVPMTVNVAVSDVLAPGFADDVLFMLDDLGLPATALVLELREHGLVDVAIEGSPLALLRSRGVRVCLDDFGTGTSSITALRELPVDVVKLDRSLAASLDGADPGQVALLESVLLLAAALRLDVVAEGVETVAERATLTDLGVIAGQGWLFGRPMTTDALQQWMLDRASTPSQVAEGWPLPVR